MSKKIKLTFQFNKKYILNELQNTSRKKEEGKQEKKITIKTYQEEEMMNVSAIKTLLLDKFSGTKHIK